MKLDNNDLLNEFYQEMLITHPNLSFERLKEVCFGPWRFLKDEMESGELSKVRFTYFGTFQVHVGRAVNMERILDQKLESNQINPNKHKSLKDMLSKFLIKNKQNEKSI